MNVKLWLPIVASACLLLVGCGDGPPDRNLVPVDGIVLLDGQPLEGAFIEFVPQGNTPGRGSIARTDSAGKYLLKTIDGVEGAAPGEYKVKVSKWVMPDGSPFEPNQDISAMDAGAVRLVAEKFEDPETTPLTVTVPASGGSIDPLEVRAEK